MKLMEKASIAVCWIGFLGFIGYLCTMCFACNLGPSPTFVTKMGTHVINHDTEITPELVNDIQDFYADNVKDCYNTLCSEPVTRRDVEWLFKGGIWEFYNHAIEYGGELYYGLTNQKVMQVWYAHENCPRSVDIIFHELAHMTDQLICGNYYSEHDDDPEWFWCHDQLANEFLRGVADDK
jgi:hypothetical protein